MQIKLGDFCYAVEQDEHGFIRRNSDVGQIQYKCPEFFKNKGYSFEQDDWSFGIILYKILIGVYPFKSKDEDELKDLIIECKL